MGYWERKQEMSAKAIAHTEEMSVKFAQEIEDSVKQEKFKSKMQVSILRLCQKV